MTKKRPFLRYPGSKLRLYPWLSQFIPVVGYDSYNEPYLGSGITVVLKANRHSLEAVNDINGDVTNAFAMLRDETDALIRAIRFTPWAYDEFKLCQLPTDDLLEKARRFYVRCWMSIKPFDPVLSMRRQKVLSRDKRGNGAMTPAARLFMQVDHLYEIAERFRGVTIENMEALLFLLRYDNEKAFFYVDPPYEPSTLERDHYAVNMTTEDHIKMGKVLLSLNGGVVLSGYSCPLYADIFEANGWVFFGPR